MTTHDPVTFPAHYAHPSGVECKDITYDLPTWLGSAIKYIWRRDRKGKPVEDRQKAIECLRAGTPERLEILAKWADNIPNITFDKANQVYAHNETDSVLVEACDLVHWYDMYTFEPEHFLAKVQGIINQLEAELTTLQTEQEAH